MRIAVLGAAGAMGRVVVRDLLEFQERVAITAADQRDVREAPAVWDLWQAAGLRLAAGASILPARLDVRDEAATAALLAGHDAVLNCTHYSWNLHVMRAALAARVPYTDLGGLYHMTLRQFELDAAFRGAGIPALLGMGSTPGITNAMAGGLARGLETVEAIHVRVGCRDRGAAGPLPVPYALDTVLDEFALDPWVLADGRAGPVPPMSGGEDVEFPPPIGRMRAMYTLHSEVAMFPRSFPGLREASFKIAFEPEFETKMRFLVELGFARTEPVVDGVSPRAVLRALVEKLTGDASTAAGPPADCDALRVDVRGVEVAEPSAGDAIGGTKVPPATGERPAPGLPGRSVHRRGITVVEPHRAWGVAAGALDTAVPLAIAGAMLARGEIATPGVVTPELVLPFSEFFAELARRGIHVRFESAPSEVAA